MVNFGSNETNSALYQLAENGLLNPSELEEAFKLSGHIPTQKEWGWFLRTALLSLATVFMVSGILFFFAWNWDGMDRLVKFGIIGGVILLTAMFAFWRGLDEFPAKLSLTASSALIGVLFAVMGQEYQSPADSWQLFFMWSIFAAGWVLISRFSPLWLGWFLLLNLTTYLWLDQAVSGGLSIFEIDRFILNSNVILMLNAILVLGWELISTRLDWMKGRWVPRTLFLLLISSGTIGMMIVIFDSYNLEMPSGSWLTLLLYFAAVSIGFYFYGLLKQDLFMVATILFSLIVLITSQIGEWMFDGGDPIAAFFLLGMIVIGLGWASMTSLRRLQAIQPKFGRLS